MSPRPLFESRKKSRRVVRFAARAMQPQSTPEGGPYEGRMGKILIPQLKLQKSRRLPKLSRREAERALQVADEKVCLLLSSFFSGQSSVKILRP